MCVCGAMPWSANRRAHEVAWDQKCTKRFPSASPAHNTPLAPPQRNDPIPIARAVCRQWSTGEAGSESRSSSTFTIFHDAVQGYASSHKSMR